MSSSVMLEGESKEPPEKWEIFAWAVRDVMSKASGIPKSEMHQRDKMKYEVMMGFRE
jgi:hypothetical protein